MEVKEKGERCSCSGEIDCLYPIEPDIWQGRCFVCGEKYVIINLTNLIHKKETLSKSGIM